MPCPQNDLLLCFVCTLISNMLKKIIKTIINTQDKMFSGCRDTKSLLLIRLDGIGDYVLFRNFIEVIKDSAKYKGYKITLLGNKLWKNIAVELDAEFIDKFIWIDTDRYQHSKRYEKSIRKKLSKMTFDTVINPIHSSAFYVHCLANTVTANEKIASQGDEFIISKEHKITSHYWYSKIIEADETNMFEFYRNKVFFEKLLGTEIDLSAPIIDYENICSSKKLPENYAVIYPQASTKSKCWSPKNFAAIADYLACEYNLTIILAGGRNFKDFKSSYRVIQNSKTNNIINLTGRVSLSELVKIISGAKILISNDTGAYHIGAATGVKTICISNGFTFGRYHPYPKEISNKLYFIYPSEINHHRANCEELIEKYRYYSPYLINSIKIADVIDAIGKLLEK